MDPEKNIILIGAGNDAEALKLELLAKRHDADIILIDDSNSYISNDELKKYIVNKVTDLSLPEPLIIRNRPEIPILEMEEIRYGHLSKKEREAEILPVRTRNEPKIGRNQSCPCGSGKKYKHCCFKK